MNDTLISAEWLVSLGLTEVQLLKPTYRYTEPGKRSGDTEFYIWKEPEGWRFGPALCDMRKPIHTQAEFWEVLAKLKFTLKASVA